MKIVVFGGSGLIGTKLVNKLRERGHEVVAASLTSAVNILTGEGVAQALKGAEVAVDVTNSPSFEDKAVMAFFETAARNVLPEEAAAGVKHHVALSVVGTDRLQASGYFRAKMVQENLIKASKIPYTIVRATQFFEFVGAIAQSGTDGQMVRLPPAMMQPIVSDDVAAALADVALANPLNGTVEIAGPEPIRMDELVRRFLGASRDARKVTTDTKATYFGTPVNDQSLTPATQPRLGPTRFDDWLRALDAEGVNMATTVEGRSASPIGRSTPRVDGPLKVSGAAKYTSDFHFPGMLYAVPVGATIANGRVVKIDAAAAERMPGVRAIFHRENIGKIARSVLGADFDGISDERRPPFEDDVVRYYGQYVALAVADTFEAAKAAADAVRVTYAAEKPNVATELKADDDPEVVATTFGMRPRLQSERGDPDAAFAKSPVKLDQTYVTPAETHNPLELHATTAIWEGEKLTLYESSQGVFNLRGVLAQMFGVPQENVRVITQFVGSGFGSKLFPWTHCSLATAAARKLGKPVKLVLSRKMMFQTVGHRPRTQQRVRLGATPDGKLVSLQHDYIYDRSMLDIHHEDCGEPTPFQYSVPNLRVAFGRAKRNIGAAGDMRGPGAVPGLYATESALNELAEQLKIDPVRLRVINEPKIDESRGLPFSSRHLLECFELGAEKFGWAKRTPAVGSMKRDGLTLGWGMAGCSWIAARFTAAASVELRDDGTVRVACGTQDIGTGTYTNLAQLAAQRTGVPLEKIEVALGDTSLPAGPLSGGSMATASIIPAVFAAADKAIGSLLNIATATPGSPFDKRKAEELALEGGRIRVKADGAGGGVPFGDLLKRANLRLVSGGGQSPTTFGNPKPKFSTHSYGCHFVEVTWQPELARLRVGRVVTVIDAGRILNPLAGRNQIEGAVVMGIGMALFEHTTYDPQNGAPINSSLADYVMTVNADVPPIEVHFLDYPDLELNELGARGIGEIGLAGIAAAITAAVHHATGVRVRELPVKIEDLLV